MRCARGAVLAMDEALGFVKENPTVQVPGHISNVSPEKINYKYPHSYPQNWVEQTYLPITVKNKFYVPQTNGSEKALVEQFVQITGKRP
jgi:putative ATPase